MTECSPLVPSAFHKDMSVKAAKGFKKATFIYGRVLIYRRKENDFLLSVSEVQPVANGEELSVGREKFLLLVAPPSLLPRNVGGSRDLIKGR